RAAGRGDRPGARPPRRFHRHRRTARRSSEHLRARHAAWRCRRSRIARCFHRGRALQCARPLLHSDGPLLDRSGAAPVYAPPARSAALIQRFVVRLATFTRRPPRAAQDARSVWRPTLRPDLPSEPSNVMSSACSRRLPCPARSYAVFIKAEWAVRQLPRRKRRQNRSGGIAASGQSPTPLGGPIAQLLAPGGTVPSPPPFEA